MALDLFLQRFHEGDAEDAVLEEASFQLIDEFATERDASALLVRLDVEGAQAEVYGVPNTPGPTGGLMVSRMDAGAADAIVRLAASAGMAILVPDGPTLLTDTSQADHLPDELKGDVRVVSEGSDLIVAIHE